MYEYISCEKEGAVALIAIKAAPKDEDAFIRLADDISAACSAIAEDGAVYAVILTGGEGAFNMKAISEPYRASDEEGVRYISPAACVSALDRPVIAAVSGLVTGPGLELLLACDIRIAAEDASFCMSQIGNGLIPGDGGTQRLPRIVGRGKALEMILTGTVMDGREAKRTGLVNRLVSPAELPATVRDMAQKISSQAPFAVKYAKEAVCQGMDMNINQGLRLEADLYFLLHTTSDRREGIEAFLEKRKPEFTGK